MNSPQEPGEMTDAEFEALQAKMFGNKENEKKSKKRAKA